MNPSYLWMNTGQASYRKMSGSQNTASSQCLQQWDGEHHHMLHCQLNMGRTPLIRHAGIVISSPEAIALIPEAKQSTGNDVFGVFFCPQLSCTFRPIRLHLCCWLMWKKYACLSWSSEKTMKKNLPVNWMNNLTCDKGLKHLWYLWSLPVLPFVLPFWRRFLSFLKKPQRSRVQI